jgi:hypothetical protein
VKNSERPLRLRRLMIAVVLVVLVLAAMACSRSRGGNRQTDTDQPAAPASTLDPAAGEIEATLDALIDQLESDDPLDDLDF